MQAMKDIWRKGAMAMILTIRPSSICSSQSFSINITKFPAAHSEILVNFRCPQTSTGEENQVIQTPIE